MVQARFAAPESPAHDVVLQSSDSISWTVSSAVLRCKSGFFDELFSDSLVKPFANEELSGGKPVIPMLATAEACDLVLPFLADLQVPTAPEYTSIKAFGTTVQGPISFNGVTTPAIQEAFHLARRLDARLALEIIRNFLVAVSPYLSNAADVLTICKFALENEEIKIRDAACRRYTGIDINFRRNPFRWVQKYEDYPQRLALCEALYEAAKEAGYIPKQ